MKDPGRLGRPQRGIWAVALLLLVAVACRNGDQSPVRAAPALAGARRIVVLAPAAAEILDRLGAVDRVVGVGDWVDWPPAVRALPRVGPFDSPNVERVLSLHADLLLTVEAKAGGAVYARLEHLGVRVVALDTSTYRGLLAAIATVGDLVGRRRAAAVEIAGIRSRLDGIAKRAATAPRRRVLVVVGRDPLFVAGPGSHLDELITVAGGQNVAGDAHSPYPMVSLEVVLQRLPEVIVDTSDNRPRAPKGRFPGSWSQWPFLPAVRENRVYWVDPIRIAVPGPRLPDMAQLLAQMIHPEIFGSPTASAYGPLTAADVGRTGRSGPS